MNNLTTSLLVKNHHYQIEEWSKQGNPIPFDSGTEQRIVTSSIPSIEMTISYRGLTFGDYELLRSAYENNNSSTFILDLDDEASITQYVDNDYLENQSDYILNQISRIDMRPELMGLNSAVW